MTSFIHEYGLVIVAVITCSMFLGFVIKLNSNKEGSLSFTYKTHMLYTDFEGKSGVELSELVDSVNGVDNTLSGMKRPYFKLDDGTEIDTTFKLEKDKKFFDGVGDGNQDDYYKALKERLMSNESRTQVLKAYKGDTNKIDLDDLHIVIVEYKPKVEYTLEGLDYTKHYVLAEEYALDEFGSRIEDGDGDFIKSKQLQYDEVIWQEPGSLNNASDSNKNIKEFKIDPDLPSRYKVIYRYQDGRLKCEYTSLFINEVRSESDILFE